jgi:hypothetical protein
MFVVSIEFLHIAEKMSGSLSLEMLASLFTQYSELHRSFYLSPSELEEEEGDGVLSKEKVQPCDLPEEEESSEAELFYLHTPLIPASAQEVKPVVTTTPFQQEPMRFEFLGQVLNIHEYSLQTIATAPTNIPLPQKMEKAEKWKAILDGLNVLLYRSNPGSLNSLEKLIELVIKNVVPLLKFLIEHEILLVLKGFSLGKIPWNKVLQTILASINYGLGSLASKLKLTLYVMEAVQNDKGRDDRMLEILQDREGGKIFTNDTGKDRAEHWFEYVSYTQMTIRMTNPGHLKIEDLISRFRDLNPSQVKTARLDEVDDDAFINRLVAPNDFPRLKFKIDHGRVQIAEHVY